MNTGEPEDGKQKEDGAWRGVSSGSERGLRTLRTLFCFVPLRVAYVLVLPVVCTWFLHYNRPRGAVVRAMRRVGSKIPLLAAFRVYLQFAFVLVDRYYVRTGRATATMRMARPSPDGWERKALSGRPLVLMGSHCGALEIGAGSLDAQGYRIRPLAQPDTGAHPLLAQVGDPTHGVTGSEPAIIVDGSIAAGLKMLEALREGDDLVLKADRALPGTRDSGLMTVRFLGAPATFSTGPARLARMAGASVMALSVFREGAARYVVHKNVVRTKDRTEEEITTGYVRHLESHIRLHPDQWFNFFPFWAEDAAPLQELPETVPPLMRRFGPSVLAGLGLGLALELLLRAIGLA
jgi:predicted LPLAT superfamily acyltransferase